MPAWGERIVVVREYADLPQVSCMPAQICRAFVLILENAGQAIPERGRIQVATRAGGTRNVEIRISDSGAGISDEDLPEIFEAFFSTRRDAPGLGLTLAHGIIKAHGGSINVRTSRESGTSFIIGLPITAAMTASANASFARR